MKIKFEYAAGIMDNNDDWIWQGFTVAYNVAQAKTLLKKKFKSKIKKGYSVEIAPGMGKKETKKKIGSTRIL